MGTYSRVMYHQVYWYTKIRIPGSVLERIEMDERLAYMGISLIRNSHLMGPYSRIMSRALWWP